MPDTFVKASDLHRAVSDAEEKAAWKIAAARLDAAEEAIKLVQRSVTHTPMIVGDHEITVLTGDIHKMRKTIEELGARARHEAHS